MFSAVPLVGSVTMTAGSIVRLKLNHFMTYDSLEFTPCSGLNLITGPNGTGKSTLLCAMCLALGGKPSNIGRSERISDFIKNGYDQAYIEIELLNPDAENIIIGRLINIMSNNSQWNLNGKSVSLKMVEREVAKFNIQTNNLCQFLPQEKVVDFSKMNEKELLESTEQAVGDQSMYDNHMKLKQLRSEYCELESRLNEDKKYLNSEQEKNKRLESEVKQHHEREKHLKRIKSLEKKIPWMKYEKVREAYVKRGEQKKRLSVECKKNSEKLKPMKKERDQLDQQLSQMVKDIELLDKEIRKKKQEVSGKMQNLEEVDSKVADSRHEICEKIKEEKARLEKLQRGKTVLRNLQNELQQVQAEDVDNQIQLARIAEELKQVQFRTLEVSTAKENAKIERARLTQKLQEVRRSLDALYFDQEHRLTILKRREPQVYEAVLWLRENNHLFKKRIYEPILTLINVPDPQSVKYIENHIAYRDLTAFFAEDPDDMNKFLAILSDDKGLDISGIHAAPVPETHLVPRVPKDRLRHYGLTNYLMELFIAPGPVMNYLCKAYGLFDIPVGREHTRDKIKHIIEDKRFPFRKFFLGDFVYRIKTSKYGDHCRSHCSQKIMDMGLLRGGAVDTSEIEILKHNLRSIEDDEIKQQDDVYSSLSENERILIIQAESLKFQKKKYTEKRDALKNLAARIYSLKEQLKFAESPICHIGEEECNLSRCIADSIQHKIEIFGLLHLLFEEIFALEKTKSQKCILRYFLLKKKDEAEKAFRNASMELRNLEQSLQHIQTEMARSKLTVQEALNHAKKVMGLNAADDIPQEVKSEFGSLPNDVTELESAVAREQAKLNCINRTNPSVVQEFINREKCISERKETIATKESELKNLEEHINSVRDQWLPAIETLIEKISVNFSRYFASLGCAGEVTLDKTENQSDFHKYGISIKVKFRNDEPLNQLSHAHHSGGECSVSTILYILSLQELTEVPFRCVDEINQGMDSINERRVFDLIVKSSCSKKKSQYFLITPKLLHGLDYPPEMDIAIIHNGSSKNCIWDIPKFLTVRSNLS